MSADNSIARGGREPGSQAEPIGVDIPPELQSRYEVRLVDTQDGEQRIGLFRPGNRETPAIEITADRIVARREEAETVDSLVRIAQHNGWDRIEVDGSPEFRKAVWTAATREGLTVGGYEATFAEQERLANTRREDAERRDRGAGDQAPALRADTVAAPGAGPEGARASEVRSTAAGAALSDADSRLLLKVSALTEDRKALQESLREGMNPLQREVQVERIDDNRGALNGALDRALESPTVIEAFERVGYEPDTLRAAGRGGEWESAVADAIFLARAGVHRDTLARESGTRASLADMLDADRESQAIAEPTVPEGRPAVPEPSPVRGEQEQHAATERRPEGDELAELFLHGATERVAADPRLAGAMQAQATMEQHIGEVFGGDATRMASANLESRHLISDALRRGLDVSARDPTPVRQLEPMQTRPDLER